MTYKFMVINLLLVGFFSTSAQAIDTWVGSKYLYSTTSQSEYALKVELNTNNIGTLITKNGSATSKSLIVNGRIEITPTTPISYESFRSIQIAETGDYEQVSVVSTLKKMILSGSDDEVMITENWENCYKYNAGGVVTNKCDLSTEQYNEGIIAREMLQTIGIENLENQNVVFPLPDLDSVFVQLNADSTVKVLASGNGMKGKSISSWAKLDNTITLNFTDDSSIQYTPTQKYEGVVRTIGILTADKIQKTVIGALFVDEKIETSNLSQSDVAGNYKTVLTSTTTQLDTLYSFDNDGFGGFEWTYAGNTEWTSWGWVFTNGVLQASRYRFENGATAESKEELKSCQKGLTDCLLHQVRTYKIIGKTGNRYNMLRTMEGQYDKNGNNPTYKEVSVWTFYKQ